MDFLNASADDIMNNVIGGTNLNYTCFNPESIDDIEQCLATLVTDISGMITQKIFSRSNNRLSRHVNCVLGQKIFCLEM